MVRTARRRRRRVNDDVRSVAMRRIATTAAPLATCKRANYGATGPSHDLTSFLANLAIALLLLNYTPPPIPPPHTPGTSQLADNAATTHSPHTQHSHVCQIRNNGYLLPTNSLYTTSIHTMYCVLYSIRYKSLTQ